MKKKKKNRRLRWIQNGGSGREKKDKDMYERKDEK